jgi:glycosyltransferase involved in cell wall biosynthesis
MIKNMTIKKKKIAIIGIVGIPAKYGGFETLTEYLTEKLSGSYDITVFCSSKKNDNTVTTHNGAELRYIPLNANGVMSIVYDIISILKSLMFADTLLILGISGCIILPFIRTFSKKKLIINIDGLEWKREKWGMFSKWFLKLSEKLAVRHADVIVADNKVIQDYVKYEYGRDSKLIAYGANHVTVELISNKLKIKYPFLRYNYAFKVCRIEPENNIHIILEAFSKFRMLNLVIIGNWESSCYGKGLKLQYKKNDNIFLFDPVYDQDLLNEFRSNCYVYIHGHSAGGTNPSLVEAMYLGLPILAYGVKYNRKTTKNRALYFYSSHELVGILENINTSVLDVVAKDMKTIAIRKYTWEIISQQYSQIF